MENINATKNMFLGILLAVALAIGGTYYYEQTEKETVHNTTASEQTKTAKGTGAQKIATSTKLFVGQKILTTFSYPSDWLVKEDDYKINATKALSSTTVMQFTIEPSGALTYETANVRKGTFLGKEAYYTNYNGCLNPNLKPENDCNLSTVYVVLRKDSDKQVASSTNLTGKIWTVSYGLSKKVIGSNSVEKHNTTMEELKALYNKNIVDFQTFLNTIKIVG
jgi:hypothetical protein